MGHKHTVKYNPNNHVLCFVVCPNNFQMGKKWISDILQGEDSWTFLWANNKLSSMGKQALLLVATIHLFLSLDLKWHLKNTSLQRSSTS